MGTATHGHAAELARSLLHSHGQRVSLWWSDSKQKFINGGRAPVMASGWRRVSAVNSRMSDRFCGLDPSSNRRRTPQHIFTFEKGGGFGTPPNGRSCDWHFPNLRDPLCFRHADLSQGPNKRRDRWRTAVFLARNCTHLRRRTHIRIFFASRMYLIISFEEVQLAERFLLYSASREKKSADWISLGSLELFKYIK